MVKPLLKPNHFTINTYHSYNRAIKLCVTVNYRGLKSLFMLVFSAHSPYYFANSFTSIVEKYYRFVYFCHDLKSKNAIFRCFYGKPTKILN